jgi:cytochrome c5
MLAMAIPLAFGVTLAQAAERSGESIVTEICATCHKKGEKGAPVIGDKNAWGKRKTQGLTNLGQHALEGIRNMPSHGGNAANSRSGTRHHHMVNRLGA